MHIRIIVPACRYDVLNGYLKRLAQMTGGYTSYKGIGGWVDDEGVLWSEPVYIVDAYWQTLAPSMTAKIQEGLLISLCLTIAAELDQECVYLSIDGKVQFVRGTNEK